MQCYRSFVTDYFKFKHKRFFIGKALFQLSLSIDLIFH